MVLEEESDMAPTAPKQPSLKAITNKLVRSARSGKKKHDTKKEKGDLCIVAIQAQENELWRKTRPKTAKSLHAHALNWQTHERRVPCKKCGVTGKETWNCKKCPFDVCHTMKNTAVKEEQDSVWAVALIVDVVENYKGKSKGKRKKGQDEQEGHAVIQLYGTNGDKRTSPHQPLWTKVDREGREHDSYLQVTCNPGDKPWTESVDLRSIVIWGIPRDKTGNTVTLTADPTRH